MLINPSVQTAVAKKEAIIQDATHDVRSLVGNGKTEAAHVIILRGAIAFLRKNVKGQICVKVRVAAEYTKIYVPNCTCSLKEVFRHYFSYQLRDIPGLPCSSCVTLRALRKADKWPVPSAQSARGA